MVRVERILGMRSQGWRHWLRIHTDGRLDGWTDDRQQLWENLCSEPSCSWDTDEGRPLSAKAQGPFLHSLALALLRSSPRLQQMLKTKVETFKL